MSELAQAGQEADAMEAALAAPLFDGVRGDVEAVLNGLNAAAWARVQDLVAERDAYLRAAGEQVDLRVAADKELAVARHAKAQMELRWQAAEKECAALRAKLQGIGGCDRVGRAATGKRFHECEKCR